MAQNLQEFIASINIAQPSWDLFIVIFALVSAFIYGLSLGRDRIVVVLVAIYMAIVVVGAVPYLETVNPAQFGLPNQAVFQIVLFLLTFVVIFILLGQSALMRTIAASEAPGRWWQVIVFSLLHVGLMLSVVLSFLPGEAQTQLAPLTRQLFIGREIQFYWIVAPILALALIRHKLEKK